MEFHSGHICLLNNIIDQAKRHSSSYSNNLFALYHLYILDFQGHSIDVGEIGIFIINGDAYVKELGYGKLISHNEKYKPIPFKSDDSIYCCGRVLGTVSL